jgi:hypothetical protein
MFLVWVPAKHPDVCRKPKQHPAYAGLNAGQARLFMFLVWVPAKRPAVCRKPKQHPAYAGQARLSIGASLL